MYSDTSGYWVYAFRQIGPHIDKLRIMAYDYSWSTAGSIGGPVSWVRGLLTYATDAVSREKVFLGTPTYGRDWVTSSAGVGCPSSGELLGLRRTMNTSEITFTSQWVRDSSSQERNRSYTEPYNNGKCTLTRSAWLPDAETTRARWQIAKDFRIAGLAQWMIGTEQADQWDLLRSAGAGTSPAPVSVSPVPDSPAATIPRAVTLRAVKVRKTKIVVKGRVSGKSVRSVTIFRKTKSQRRKLVSVIPNANGRFRAVIRGSRPTMRLFARTSAGRSALVIVRR